VKFSLRYLFLFIGSLLTLGLSAQQMSGFTQYQSTIMYSNPAYAGMRRGICINGLMRQQWAGFSDTERGDDLSPQTFLISVDSPIKVLHGGVGGSIVQDVQGSLMKDINLQFSYSFHADLSIGTLGIGVGVNLTNKSLDGSKFDPVDTDPILLTSEQGDLRADANFGLFLMNPDRYYFGIAVSNLLETTYKKLDPLGNDAGMKNDRTFVVNAAYNFVLNNPLFEIEPSAMVISDLTSTQYNLSAIVTYNDRFWGGLNGRFGNFESIGIIVGVSFKDFRIGYSYDINLMGLSIPGSHEISLGYCFKLKGDHSKTSYKNTRYL
jgi:type IX secretion system PorP/SprF family membrane protein